MKIKKLLFLSLFFIIGLFLFMPNSVNATDEPVELNKIKIEMADPKEEGKIPESAKIILTNDTEEKVFNDVKMIWVKYDSEGNDIELGSVFEKNFAYRFDFDDDDIEEFFEDEDCEYSIAEDDLKIYVNNVCVEAGGFSLPSMVYIGGIKSVSLEVEDLIVGKSLPKTVKYVYETESAEEKIELVLNCFWMANGERVDRDAIAEIGLEYEPAVSSYDNKNNTDFEKFEELSRKQDFRTKMYQNGELISLENGIPSLRAKKEVEYIEKITINIRNKEKFDDITVDDMVVLNFLAHKGLIFPSADDNMYDKSWKLLWGYDEADNIILADGLTVADNILYTLTPEDEIFYAEYTDIIPKQIEIIFVETYKVTFDANEGTFKEGKILPIEKWENGMKDTLEIPTRSGYKFLGFFTEKTGGTKLELILAESGIDKDMTFYAQWEKISDSGEQEDNTGTPDSGEQEDDAGTPDSGEQEGNTGNTESGNTNTDNTNTNKPTGKNPQTGDNLILFVTIFVISIIGFITVTKMRKKANNN